MRGVCLVCFLPIQFFFIDILSWWRMCTNVNWGNRRRRIGESEHRARRAGRSYHGLCPYKESLARTGAELGELERAG